MKWIILLLVSLVMALSVTEAKCNYCPTFRCLDADICGEGCACIRTGTKYGYCVSILMGD